MFQTIPHWFVAPIAISRPCAIDENKAAARKVADEDKHCYTMRVHGAEWRPVGDGNKRSAKSLDSLTLAEVALAS